jgi:hypothetical protein
MCFFFLLILTGPFDVFFYSCKQLNILGYSVLAVVGRNHRGVGGKFIKFIWMFEVDCILNFDYEF